MDPITAQTASVAAMLGRVAREGTVLAFEKTFLLQGIAFIAVLPLLFFLRVDRQKADAPQVDMHME
jgi:hypothetical protein